jgi:hypothetical protein
VALREGLVDLGMTGWATVMISSPRHARWFVELLLRRTGIIAVLTDGKRWSGEDRRDGTLMRIKPDVNRWATRIPGCRRLRCQG